jgi:hypothetical protein
MTTTTTTTTTTGTSLLLFSSLLLLLLRSNGVHGQQQAAYAATSTTASGANVNEFAVPAVGFGRSASTETTKTCKNNNDDDDNNNCHPSSALQLAYEQIQWLEQRGGTFAHDLVEIRPVVFFTNETTEQAKSDKNNEHDDVVLLGYFARQDIPKDTVIMKIPRSALLTAGTSFIRACCCCCCCSWFSDVFFFFLFSHSLAF